MLVEQIIIKQSTINLSIIILFSIEKFFELQSKNHFFFFLKKIIVLEVYELFE